MSSIRQYMLRIFLSLARRVSEEKAFELSVLALLVAKDAEGAAYLRDHVVPRRLRDDVWKVYVEAGVA